MSDLSSPEQPSTPGWKARIAGIGRALRKKSGGAATPLPTFQITALRDEPLIGSSPWRHLTTVWNEAQEVGSGKRGDYPFDAAGQRKLMAELDQTERDLEALQKTGALSAAEAELLLQEKALLKSGVAQKRPTEMMEATCYLPSEISSAEDSLGRLLDRLPLLKRLAEEGGMHRATLEKVVGTIAGDVNEIASEAKTIWLEDEDKAKAKQVHAEAAAMLEDIKALLRQK